MGASAGPNLARIGRGGDSNLVLEMDAHDAKSYPGEPTTNVINTLMTGWTNDNGCTVTATGETFQGMPVYSVLFPDGSLPRTHTNFTYTSGSDFTMHVWYRYVSGETGTYLPQPYITAADWSATFATGTFPVTKEWTRMTPLTGTSGGTVTAMFNLYRSNSGSATDVTMEFAMPQMEEKSYATPFVREGNGGTGTYRARPASTNLMIHGNVGTGTSFEDSSPSKHTITTSGNTTHSAAQSKFGGGSVYFDGTGDYLTIADHADWTFGTGDFTIDLWIYPTTIGSGGNKNYVGTNPNQYLTFASNNSGGLLFYIGDGSWISVPAATSDVVVNDAWQHVAVTRVSGTVYLFHNGVLITSRSQTDSIDPPNIEIGAYGGGASDLFVGYMDEVRITKGTALWTAAFTPPTRRNLSAPVVDRSGNYNGGNFATKETTDVTTYRVGEVIRPIDSAIWDFDGTDDKISIATDSVDIYCFTIAIKQDKEYTPELTPAQGNVGFFVNGNAFNGITIGSWTGTMTDETLTWWGYGTAGSGSGGTYIRDTILAGWHIFTFNWNGSDYDIWVDGIKKTTYARGGGSGHSGLFAGVTAITPGWQQGWDSYFTGQMGFFRGYDKSLTDQQIIENFNQQNSRFNPPNWANRDIVQDSLVLWLDAGIPASYPGPPRSGTGDWWIDLATTGEWGKYGDPIWTGGGYWDFDGSGDAFLLNTHTTALDPGTGDMTWEVWFKTDLTTGDRYIYSNYEAPNDRIEFRVGTGGSVCRMLMNDNTVVWYRDTVTSVVAGTWYHLVVRYDRGAATMQDGVTFYVNGVADAGKTDGGTWVQNATIAPASSSDWIGRRGNGGSQLDGSIAVFRIYNKKLSASEIEQNFIVQRQRFGV